MRLHIIVMVWPWSVGSIMDFNWIGPTRNAENLRTLKHHLDSGGIIYVQRSAVGFASIISRWPHDRTTESGTMLNVSTRASIYPTGAFSM